MFDRFKSKVKNIFGSAENIDNLTQENELTKNRQESQEGHSNGIFQSIIDSGRKKMQGLFKKAGIATMVFGAGIATASTAIGTVEQSTSKIPNSPIERELTPKIPPKYREKQTEPNLVAGLEAGQKVTLPSGLAIELNQSKGVTLESIDLKRASLEQIQIVLSQLNWKQVNDLKLGRQGPAAWTKANFGSAGLWKNLMDNQGNLLMNLNPAKNFKSNGWYFLSSQNSESKLRALFKKYKDLTGFEFIPQQQQQFVQKQKKPEVPQIRSSVEKIDANLQEKIVENDAYFELIFRYARASGLIQKALGKKNVNLNWSDLTIEQKEKVFRETYNNYKLYSQKLASQELKKVNFDREIEEMLFYLFAQAKQGDVKPQDIAKAIMSVESSAGIGSDYLDWAKKAYNSPTKTYNGETFDEIINKMTNQAVGPKGDSGDYHYIYGTAKMEMSRGDDVQVIKIPHGCQIIKKGKKLSLIKNIQILRQEVKFVFKKGVAEGWSSEKIRAELSQVDARFDLMITSKITIESLAEVITNLMELYGDQLTHQEVLVLGLLSHNMGKGGPIKVAKEWVKHQKQFKDSDLTLNDFLMRRGKHYANYTNRVSGLLTIDGLLNQQNTEMVVSVEKAEPETKMLSEKGKILAFKPLNPELLKKNQEEVKEKLKKLPIESPSVLASLSNQTGEKAEIVNLNPKKAKVTPVLVAQEKKEMTSDLNLKKRIEAIYGNYLTEIELNIWGRLAQEIGEPKTVELVARYVDQFRYVNENLSISQFLSRQKDLSVNLITFVKAKETSIETLQPKLKLAKTKKEPIKELRPKNQKIIFAHNENNLTQDSKQEILSERARAKIAEMRNNFNLKSELVLAQDEKDKSKTLLTSGLSPLAQKKIEERRINAQRKMREKEISAIAQVLENISGQSKKAELLKFLEDSNQQFADDYPIVERFASIIPDQKRKIDRLIREIKTAQLKENEKKLKEQEIQKMQSNILLVQQALPEVKTILGFNGIADDYSNVLTANG